MRPLVARIDLAALKHNLLIAQNAAPNSKNFAVIKADAYGHGAVQCALALVKHTNGFAVATVEEGIDLRLAKISLPIMILSAFSQADEIELLTQHQLTPVIHSVYQLELLKQHDDLNSPINCWLKIDTGMNRLGLNEKEFLHVLKTANTLSSVNVVGLMSHFASSDETRNDFTRTQINNFLELTRTVNLPLSLANSCAIMAWPDSHRDWNRPGIMLYGTSSIDVDTDLNLKPVMQFQSELISIKNLKKGQSVGYGQAFTADEDMRIGVVACGYADGYPRSMPNGGPIRVKGHKTRILGRVSMDTLSVDLTNITNPQIGDQVELWGGNLSVREVADAAQTIPYELLTRVSKRVPRTYHN